MQSFYEIAISHQKETDLVEMIRTNLSKLLKKDGDKFYYLCDYILKLLYIWGKDHIEQSSPSEGLKAINIKLLNDIAGKFGFEKIPDNLKIKNYSQSINGKFGNLYNVNSIIHAIFIVWNNPERFIEEMKELVNNLAEIDPKLVIKTKQMLEMILSEKTLHHNPNYKSLRDVFLKNPNIKNNLIKDLTTNANPTSVRIHLNDIFRDKYDAHEPTRELTEFIQKIYPEFAFEDTEQGWQDLAELIVANKMQFIHWLERY